MPSTLTNRRIVERTYRLPLPKLAAYTGVVATNCRFPYYFNATNKQTMSRTAHFMRGDVTSIQVRIPNWYWTSITTRLETNPGNTASVKAALEYPAGVFNQILFSGSATGTVPNGGDLLSDVMTGTPPPDGAMFWIRIWRSCASGICYSGLGAGVTGLRNDALGEGMTFAVTVTDQTMGGAITNTDSGSIFFPSLIIGTTTRPAIFIDGDSRTYGQGDTPDASNDCGELARSIGPYYGYFNAGSWGEGFASANGGTNYAKRIAALTYCSHVVSARGINALRTGGEAKTAAAVEAEAQTFWAKFSGKPIFATTLAPATASSDSWATIANQTLNANQAQVLLYNTYIRGIPSPLTGYFDVADSIASSRTSSLWKINGTAFGTTPDGLHESVTAYLGIKNDKVINPLVFK